MSLRLSVTSFLPTLPCEGQPVYGWGPDGRYFKIVPQVQSLGTGRRWVQSRVAEDYSVYIYTGNKNDGLGGYRDHSFLYPEDYKGWTRGMRLTPEEDPAILNHQWEGIVGVLSTLLEDGTIHPEMLDNL